MGVHYEICGGMALDEHLGKQRSILFFETDDMSVLELKPGCDDLNGLLVLQRV